ncbi:mitochondrial ribosomal protein S31 [Colletes latitarsis]|uniref:mitochondrial ribosomal protein S31 n=1 Tax=Colletes latitarsis TaxID=2605962 RepID=UPI004036D65B
MLLTYFLSRNINTEVRLSYQWLSITFNTVRLSSNSSSSDSSDSDSDLDSHKNGKQQIKKSTTNSKSNTDDNDVKFNNMINNVLKNKPSKNIDVKIKVANKDKNLEKQIFRAANKVTTTDRANREGVLASLLKNISDTQKRFPDGKQNHPQFFDKNKHQTKTSNYTSNFDNIQNVPQSKVLHKLKQETNSVDKQSVIAMLMNESKNVKRNVKKDEVHIEHSSNKMWVDNFPEIFKITDAPSSSTPELKTWEMCETNELKLWTTRHPENGFQEMARWTEEGKLWKFPIDNEQGMEEEHNVHFSKHVFLEHHLTGWCPTKGPIRHFMELVCIGLSKNPYMTVEEKYEHIMWYKEYFESKSDLLQKLGIGEITPQNTEKQNKIE